MKLKIFALNATREFGQQVTDLLDVPLSVHDERFFHDREVYVASLENVRGCDVFVISSLYSDDNESVNSKLMKLLVFIGSLRDASAARITAVIPYYPYARQDRKTASRAPITTKYMARIMESVGTDRILTIDAHNPTAVQNAYQINVDLLEANILFARHMAQDVQLGPRGVSIMSPDTGGMGRTRKFRSIFEKFTGESASLACLDKIHNNEEITGDNIIGDVYGKTVIIVDDMISSGKTNYECIKAAKRHGAEYVWAVCATNGLFVGKADEYLDQDFLKNIVITDTIEPFRLTNPAVRDKLSVISCSELFAEAIKRIHRHESITDLFNQDRMPVTV